MRIISNLNINLESINNLLKFEEGSIIKARVLEVKENMLLLVLPNGANIKAVAESTERFEPNQQLLLNVVSAEKNELPKLEILDPNDAIVKAKVNELGLKDDVDIKSFKKLLSLNINNNENFEQITKNFKYLSTMLKNISPLLEESAASKEEFLNVLKKELDVSDFSEFEKSDLKKLAIKSFDIKPEINRPIEEKTIENKEIKPNNTVQKEPIIKEDIIKNILGNDFVKENSLDSDKLLDVFAKLIKFGKELTIEHINIFNKLSTDNLLKEYNTIREEILKLDDFKGKKEILDLLKGLPIKDFTKEEVKEFISKLYSIDSQIEHKTDHLKSSLDIINKSIQFMDKTNDELAFFQLPIEYRDNTYNMDLFVKSKKNQVSKNKKILLSLDTNYLKNVSVIIDYNKNLDLRFKVENEAVKELFELNMERLKQSIINEYKQINIAVDTQSKKEDVVDNFIKDENIHYINVEV